MDACRGPSGAASGRAEGEDFPRFHRQVLPKHKALALLLREGGCSHLLDAPPPAALEAVELCGRLPLALGIAGGIVAELADTWQDELVGLLREEFQSEASVEERVVFRATDIRHFQCRSMAEKAI